MAIYYNSYKKLMAHWHKILPEGAIYDLSYDDLVTNPEPAIKALVAHCGLDWEDACLTPQKTRRAVSTASAAQVRAPISATSVERWRRYEKHLGPLLETLET